MGRITLRTPTKTSFPVWGKDVPVYYERFENPSEFMDTIKSRKSKDGGRHDLNINREFSDPEFRCAKSTNDAIEMFRLGKEPDKGQYARMNAQFEESFKNSAVRRITRVYSPAFGVPSVPLLLSNDPNYRIGAIKRKIPKTAVSIVVDIGCSAYISSERMKECGTDVVRMIAELEAQNIKVELFVGSSSWNRDRILTEVMPAKKVNEPLDIQRLGYLLTNPSFFRVITFGWIASHPKYTGNDGLGAPLKGRLSPQELAEFYKSVHGLEHAITFQSLCELNGFEERKKKILECLGI